MKVSSVQLAVVSRCGQFTVVRMQFVVISTIISGQYSAAMIFTGRFSGIS
ncbi:hypothetical protein [Aquiflexum gelatinilyticum]|nr:hypothetical protein [Aquiflexum gelatinilyticum]MCS4434717.1 hypothetical protein [Aquiflexum gelatinilyticum]